jgi:hypothetical protein
MAMRRGRPIRRCARTDGAQRLAIDERQPLGLEIDLGVEPGPPPAENVGPLLFGGARGFW